MGQSQSTAVLKERNNSESISLYDPPREHSKKVNRKHANDQKKGNTFNKLPIHMPVTDYKERRDDMDINEMQKSLIKEIGDTRRELKDDIKRVEDSIDRRLCKVEDKLNSIDGKTIENMKFWIGIAIPTIIGIGGIIATLIATGCFK